MAWTTTSAQCSSGRKAIRVGNQQRLQRDLPRFTHHELDIRDRSGVLTSLKDLRPGVIVHAAAQPSHTVPVQFPRACGSLSNLP